ncbi:hypothetical protein [Chitinimonas lacunae]|uniref:DUF3325 domain-containing protein n=1 Tax=Chitinimonas lacunae TaxID=1963018 RepID=A0ABV8MSU7_9NEIS
MLAALLAAVATCLYCTGDRPRFRFHPADFRRHPDPAVRQRIAGRLLALCAVLTVLLACTAERWPEYGLFCLAVAKLGVVAALLLGTGERREAAEAGSC